MQKRETGNRSYYMDYKHIFWVFFHDTDVQELEQSDQVLLGSDGAVPVHFFNMNAEMKKMPLVVLSGGYYQLGDKYFTKRSQLSSYEFLYTTDGCGIIEYEGKRYHCTPNTAILIDCRKWHHLYVEPGKTWSYKHIHFIAGNDSNYMINKALGFIEKASELEEYIDRIAKHLTYSNVGTPYKITRYLIDLITEMITQTLTVENISTDNSKMKQALEHIQKNLHREITIEELSGVVYLSPYYFSRQFKKYYEMSPYQYILQCRINTAKIMLLEKATVQDITDACGFGTPSNFYRRFKRITGQTPAEFIKQNT